MVERTVYLVYKWLEILYIWLVNGCKYCIFDLKMVGHTLYLTVNLLDMNYCLLDTIINYKYASDNQ